MQWHIYGLLADLQRAMGRVETQLKINTRELHDIKLRTTSLEHPKPTRFGTMQDWYPALIGIVALVLALIGRGDLAARLLAQ